MKIFNMSVETLCSFAINNVFTNRIFIRTNNFKCNYIISLHCLHGIGMTGIKMSIVQIIAHI